MSTTVRHNEPMGKTTNWRPTGVYVERVVNLTPDLSEIKARRVENILIRKGDGYADHVEWKLEPKHALELYRALGNALVAIREVDPLEIREREKQTCCCSHSLEDHPGACDVVGCPCMGYESPDVCLGAGA